MEISSLQPKQSPPQRLLSTTGDVIRPRLSPGLNPSAAASPLKAVSTFAHLINGYRFAFAFTVIVKL